MGARASIVQGQVLWFSSIVMNLFCARYLVIKNPYVCWKLVLICFKWSQFIFRCNMNYTIRYHSWHFGRFKLITLSPLTFIWLGATLFSPFRFSLHNGSWEIRISIITSKLRVTGLCARNSPLNYPKKWVTRKMFPFDDVIMMTIWPSLNIKGQ